LNQYDSSFLQRIDSVLTIESKQTERETLLHEIDLSLSCI